MALSGLEDGAERCPLSRVKRTSDQKLWLPLLTHLGHSPFSCGVKPRIRLFRLGNFP
jgi:hypothetical protein